MRRVSCLLALSCVIAAPAPASADDGREVRTCLESIVTIEDFRTQCIGIVTAQCQADPAMKTTRGSIDCLGRERLAWDGALNGIYKDLRGLMESDGQAAVKAAQLAWINERDASCAVESAIYDRIGSGSASAEAEASCLRNTTAMRAVKLWYWHNLLKE